MHIKQVTICGFKTYRDATTVSNFHEGYNVVGTCVSAVAASFPRACCIVSGCQLRGCGSLDSLPCDATVMLCSLLHVTQLVETVVASRISSMVRSEMAGRRPRPAVPVVFV